MQARFLSMYRAFVRGRHAQYQAQRRPRCCCASLSSVFSRQLKPNLKPHYRRKSDTMIATASSQKAFLGTGLQTQQPKSRRQINTQVQANKGGKKLDIKKQGLSGIKNAVVKSNLMGVSEKMNKKGWTDSQGRKGKGFGVYRYASKYGANVDGYSPIYTPDTWSESGSNYSLGTKGLIAWAGLVVVLLGVGLTLILTTSQV